MTALPLPVRAAGHDRPRAAISPSILSCDFARLAEECKRMTELGADWLHVDIMDGHSVPNLTIGHPVVHSLRKHTTAFLDCHLMVSNPKQWVQDYKKAGANMYTFHLEAAVTDVAALSAAAPHPAMVELCQEVRQAGMYVGIALKPATAAELVVPYVEAGLVDMVLVLTVEPGFGGQSFMADVVGKARLLRTRFPDLSIQVDGGIAASTIDAAAAAGANVIVAGTAIFGAADPGEVIRVLRHSVDAAAARGS